MNRLVPLAALFLLLFLSCLTEDPNAGSDTDWVMISAGLAHTCGLHEDGTIECWGCSDTYDFGQCEVPDDEFKLVDAGDFHTCALTVEGYAVCWGCTGIFFGEDVNKGQCNPPGYIKYDMINTGMWTTVGLNQDGDLEEYGTCWSVE